MRRRPKLIDAITRSLNAHFSGGCADAAMTLVGDLDDAGYDVIEKATRRRERRDQWTDRALREAAEREAEGTRAWVRERRAEMIRLEDRCSFLYTTAVDHGVPEDALSGGGRRQC